MAGEEVSWLGHLSRVMTRIFKGLDTFDWTHDSDTMVWINLLGHMAMMHEEKVSQLRHLGVAYDLDMWCEDRIFE